MSHYHSCFRKGKRSNFPLYQVMVFLPVISRLSVVSKKLYIFEEKCNLYVFLKQDL